jgi:hypothetical protein
MSRRTLREIASLIESGQQNSEDLPYDLLQLSAGPLQAASISDSLLGHLQAAQPALSLLRVLNEITKLQHGFAWYQRFAVFLIDRYGPRAQPAPVLRGEGGPVRDDDEDVRIVQPRVNKKARKMAESVEVIEIDDNEKASVASGQRFFKAEQALWAATESFRLATEALAAAQAEHDAASQQHMKDLSEEAERDDQGQRAAGSGRN